MRDLTFAHVGIVGLGVSVRLVLGSGLPGLEEFDDCKAWPSMSANLSHEFCLHTYFNVSDLCLSSLYAGSGRPILLYVNSMCVKD